ncbi:MAG TPA: radical SAM protein [Verrucomicrobiae bacterium]|nr:radical SAM protein [Verrucomicrobiae bacterium]
MADKPIQIRSNLAVVQDHSRQFADFTFVYPVISRRSRGLSLGINLNPDKLCNFDCVYCEVDRKVPGRVSEVNLDQVRDELAAMIHFVRDGGLAKEPKFDELPSFITRNIKDIAFSGDGEPTMIHNFAECADAVAAVKRRERLDKTKMVLITDAAGLDKVDVKRGLEIMDVANGEVWCKLDAGTESYFRTVNRTAIRFERILKNLGDTAKARPIVVQSLFLKVRGEVIPSAELNAYCDRLNEIVRDGGRIKEVHAYTTARPTPEVYASRLSTEELNAIADGIRQGTGLSVFAFD